MKEDGLTETVIGAAIEVHSHLGAGLLESAYEECLCHELALRQIEFKRQVSLPVEYKGIHLDGGFRMDILLPGLLVIEVKAVERILPVHLAQLITYLRLASLPTGLLLNFNVAHMKQGIRRLSTSRKTHSSLPSSHPPCEINSRRKP